MRKVAKIKKIIKKEIGAFSFFQFRTENKILSKVLNSNYRLKKKKKLRIKKKRI
jgi:hypothetical protein